MSLKILVAQKDVGRSAMYAFLCKLSAHRLKSLHRAFDVAVSVSVVSGYRAVLSHVSFLVIIHNDLALK